MKTMRKFFPHNAMPEAAEIWSEGREEYDRIAKSQRSIQWGAEVVEFLPGGEAHYWLLEAAR